MEREVKNIRALSDSIQAEHEHVVVASVNDHHVKLAVNEVDYPWHNHPNADEFFLVTEGELTIEFEDAERVTLRVNDSVVIPAGVVHRTRPAGRAVNLLVEPKNTTTEFRDSDA